MPRLCNVKKFANGIISLFMVTVSVGIKNGVSKICSTFNKFSVLNSSRRGRAVRADVRYCGSYDAALTKDINESVIFIVAYK